MSLYSIKSETLTNIGDAIRAKGGTSDAIPVTSLADAITNLPSGGGGGDIEIPTQIVMNSGNASYFFAGDKMKWALDLIPDNQKIEFIFTDAYNPQLDGVIEGCTGDYSKCTLRAAKFSGPLGSPNEVTHLPEIRISSVSYTTTTGAAQLFYSSGSLRNIPRDFFYPCDESGNKLSAPREDLFSSRYGIWGLCYGCYSLRNLPELPTHITREGSLTKGYMEAFYDCYSLDKIEGLPVTLENLTLDWNAFSDTFTNCKRISEMTFHVKPDGTPYKCNWSNQVIDLSQAGYGFSESNCDEYNGLSKEGELSAKIINRAELLTNMPDDWWTNDYHYARYNLNSAIRTINSLPDCSSGSGNIIKFKVGQGQYGNITGDTRINNLTEEQIAVATAKGWTVSM